MCLRKMLKYDFGQNYLIRCFDVYGRPLEVFSQVNNNIFTKKRCSNHKNRWTHHHSPEHFLLLNKLSRIMLINKELDLAWEFVERTNRNVFLTGKAGTGKTTFLRKVKAESQKRLVVVAPTGVAAINAQGQTIHSLFQMPFGPILPEGQDGHSARTQRKFTKKKIDLIRSLDLVIIDEISMVRADLLDGINNVLQRFRGNELPFGGAQLLMIGDLQQLAPVVKPDEWDLLRNHYENPFFFSSKAYQKASPVNIELKHIYRQEDEFFIKILNEVRSGNISQGAQDALNKRYVPDFTPPKDQGFITLTTHNNRADAMNQTELNRISNRSFIYSAKVADNFPEHAYPTSERLQLKKGAQVMFIKNDSNPLKRYFNGKIGTIIDLDSESLTVQCPGDIDDIEVTRETWENIKYTIDKKTKEINADIKGSFTQIPLRLAWAITIHKSQGLTFDHAIIDAESSFAHGQTYVALSRCKTLEGIVLKKPIGQKSIINDGRVSSFTEQVENNHPDDAELNQSKKLFELNLFYELLDFQSLTYPIRRLITISSNNQNAIKGDLFDSLYKIQNETITHLIKTNQNFKVQLSQMSAEITQPSSDESIQNRIKKAVTYFQKTLDEQIKKPLEELSFSTDNQSVKKDLEKHFDKLDELVNIKSILFKGMSNGFSVMDYLKLRAQAILNKPEKTKEKKEYRFDGEHAKLIAALRSYRHDIADEEGVPHFHIFTQASLFEMVEFFPTTPKQLLAIKGIGKKKVADYGESIIKIIQDYCVANDITPEIEILKERPQKKRGAKKGDSHKETFDLFKNGKSIEEIAKERGLVTGTIESHLTKYITDGELEITEIIPKEEFDALKKIIESTNSTELKVLKSAVGNDCSWSQLRMVLAALK